MKAIILAAGYGRRMRPLTDTTHKALLNVAGKTIIARLVEGLVANDVRDIVVVTGYRAHEIEEHLRSEFPSIVFRFVENSRYAETNNIYSMALAFEHEAIDDDILLIESDLVCDAEVFARVIRSPRPNVALVDRYRSGMDGTVVAVKDGVITDVIPPHLQQGDFSFADKYKTLNIYKFSREFCESTFRRLLTYYARVIDDNCYYELILGILIYMRKATIAAEILESVPWAEVDDPNDLRTAQFVFEPSSRRTILNRAKGGYWAFDVLDFSYLRNMYFPTAAMFAELRAALPALLQNYGSCQGAVDEKLAYGLLCRPDRVHALNGASQLFPWLKSRFGGQRVLLPDPTFGEWKRAFPNSLVYGDRVGLDLAEIERRSVEADVVVFVNPNNPTGTLLDGDWIHAFARGNPGKTFLVDESFQGFSAETPLTARLEGEPLPNVLVLASLSKTLGVPGARLGYVYCCDSALTGEILDSLPIWNANSVAEHFLELMLKHRESLAESYARTAADREALATGLRSLPRVEEVYPSAANFLLARFESAAGPSDRIVDHLLREDSIFVKDVSDRFGGSSVWFRFAVRLPRENERLCEALGRALANAEYA